MWPVGEDAQRGVRFGIAGIAVGAGSKHPDMAWKLAKFLASASTLDQLLKAGFNTGVPGLANVDYANLLVSQAVRAGVELPVGFEYVAEAPKYARPQTWCFSVGNAACQAVNGAVRDLTFIANELKPVESTLEEASERATALLQAYLSR